MFAKPNVRFAATLVLIALTFVPVARADIFSDNIANLSGGAEDATPTRYLAASFTTSTTTYYLTSVTLQLANPTAGTAALDLYSNGNLEPGALVATLTAPGSFSPIAAPTTFTAPAMQLAQNQTYWLVLRPLTGAFTWSWTTTETGTGPGFQLTWDTSSDAAASWYTCDRYPLQLTVNASTTIPTPDGDMNCDSVVSVLDIPPFITALVDPAAFASTGCNITNGDINHDGATDGDDIEGFIDLLY